MSLIIKDYFLSDGEYLKDEYNKKQIFIHHTAGSHRPDYVIDYWNRDKKKSNGNRLRIATSYVIGGLDIKGKDKSYDGLIYKAFEPKYWAFHLGVPTLEKHSIGIELCNYGPIILSKNGKYFNYVNIEVPKEHVYELDKPFRGYRFYHKYTQKQIESLYNLLLFLSKEFSINLSLGMKSILLNESLNESDSFKAFNYNLKALNGEIGLWTHTNVRRDKFDCHPQPELINMIKSL